MTVSKRETESWRGGEVKKKGVQGGDHCYLGYEALRDGHRVGVALLKIMKKVPETHTSTHTSLSEISSRCENANTNDLPSTHCSKLRHSGARVTPTTEIRS